MRRMDVTPSRHDVCLQEVGMVVTETADEMTDAARLDRLEDDVARIKVMVAILRDHMAATTDLSESAHDIATTSLSLACGEKPWLPDEDCEPALDPDVEWGPSVRSLVPGSSTQAG